MSHFTRLNPLSKIRGPQQDYNWKSLRGTEITIPAGIQVHSLHPSRGGFSTTTKKQKIRIHHFVPGVTLQVGYFYPLRDEEPCWYISGDFMVETARQLYGSLDPEVLRPYLISEVQSYRTVHHDGSDAQLPNEIAMLLPVTDPVVNWPGAGGYWKSANVNDIPELVEKLQALTPSIGV